MKNNRQVRKLLLANGAFSLKNKYVDPVFFCICRMLAPANFSHGLDHCNCPDLDAHCNCGNNRFRKRSTTLKTVLKYIKSRLF